MQDCMGAAKELGFIARDLTVIHYNTDVTRFPLGCLIRRAEEEFTPDDNIFFNTMAPNKTGDPASLSICTKSKHQGEYIRILRS